MRNGRNSLDESLITRRHVLQAFAAIGGSSLVMGTMDAWGLMGSSAAKRPVLVGRSPGNPRYGARRWHFRSGGWL